MSLIMHQLIISDYPTKTNQDFSKVTSDSELVDE